MGLFAIASAFMLGAERVIAIDRYEDRLQLAHKLGAEILNYDQTDIQEVLNEMTAGRGPDRCIDAVGMEAHGHGLTSIYDRTKQALMLETDRPIALREAMFSCRGGGTISVPGVYGGFSDKLPFGSVMNRSITIKTGQTHVQHYMKPLLERIEKGEIDPSFLITHTMKLEDAPQGYKIFRNKEDHCVKVVLKP